MKKSFLLRFINFWPPFIGAGIRVKSLSKDYTSLDVEMKQHFWNKNAQGVHFGGSIYSMTDPFYALILMQNLGPDYIIWDKESTIRYKKPGKGKLTAHFNIARDKIDELKNLADTQYKVEPVFTVIVKDEAGDTVAEVDKTLYIRRKDRAAHPKQ